MNGYSDGYSLRLARPEEAETLHALMMGVWEGLENREVFAVEDLDLDWVRDKLGPGGFGVVACGPDGRLAGMLLMAYPGLSPENLGWDVGLPEAELNRVCLMETAAVLPAHRGHGLERRMLAYAEKLMESECWPLRRIRWRGVPSVTSWPPSSRTIPPACAARKSAAIGF